MNNPLVSIIIPVYQRGKLACEAIDSALKQDYTNCEIIVGDNCSTDGTYELLKEKYNNIDNILLFRNDSNLGAVENWKKCLKRARGEYIKFLWSDDLMCEDFIRRAVDYLENDKNLAFVYSSVIIFSQDVKDIPYKKITGEEKYCFGNTGIYEGEIFIHHQFNYKKSNVPVSPGCAVFRRNKVCILDTIPNKFNYTHKNNGAGTDVLIFLEALSHKEKFAYINEPLNFFREHPESISLSDRTIYIGYNTAKIYYLKKYQMIEYIPLLMEGILINMEKNYFFHNIKRNQLLDRYFEGINYKKPNIYMLIRVFIKKLIRKLKRKGNQQ